MLVILLLASRVAGEWVEIAQHQHRMQPSRRVTFSLDGNTKANNIYANYSLPELPWHRSGLHKIPNYGSVKRVQLQDKEKDIFSVGMLSEMKESSSTTRRYETVGPVRAPNIKVEEETETVHFGKINKTNVRLHSPNRHFDIKTEKSYSESPKILNANTQISEKNRYQEIIIADEEGDIIEANRKPLKVNLNLKHVLNSSSIIPTGVQFGREVHVNIEQYLKESENKAENKPSGEITNIDVMRTNNITKKILLENHITSPLNPYSSKPVVKHFIEYNFGKDAERQTQLDNTTEIHKSKQIIKNKSHNYNEPSEAKHEVNLRAKTKTNTVQGIWKLMKVVTDNISRNTRRSFKSKIRYLEDLRDGIIANVAERIEQAWPDDAGVEGENVSEIKKARRRRAARGHVEFPSSESALMTISFLTFAVFLIKLVLQVIHTYKNKTMMVTPAVVAAVGRAAASLREQSRS